MKDCSYLKQSPYQEGGMFDTGAYPENSKTLLPYVHGFVPVPNSNSIN